MGTSSHDFVTVDMRGMKAALVACAEARRTTASVVVRAAVARELEQAPQVEDRRASQSRNAVQEGRWTKLSIRMSRAEAARLAAGAKAAGLSRGAYIAGLTDGIPVLTAGAGRQEHIAALMTSCSELSTLSRNVHQLTSLLGTGNVERAIEYRDRLITLADEVKGHLHLAARALSALRRPERETDLSSVAGRHQRSRPWQKA